MPAVSFSPIEPLTPALCPPNSRDHAALDAPLGRKMMAAKNLLPLRPPEIATTLAVLLFDPNDQVAGAALESIRGLPDGLLSTAMSYPVHAAVLDVFARLMLGREPVMTAIVTNEVTSDLTITYLAGELSGHTLAIVGNNQVRYLRCPAIIEALYKNPAALMSQIEAMVEYAVRAGIMLDSIPDFAIKAAEIRGEKIDDEDQDALAEQAQFDGLSDEEYLKVLQQFGAFARTPEDEKAARDQSEPEEEQAGTGDMNAKLAKMNLSQKLRVAMLGDKSARGILIRSPLKSVAKMVLKNPKLTLEEVALFSASKSTPEDCIRIIANHREWQKSYIIAHAICCNPKSPIRNAMRLMHQLNDKDLRQITRNRNLSSPTQREARKILEVREKRRS